MEPNLVGDPKARPEQFIKSCFVQYTSSFSGIFFSVCSVTEDTFGTVLILTFKFSCSAPSAIA